MSDFVTDESCRLRTGEILTALHGMERRLFKDNGNISIQTRLDRHEQTICTIRRLTWVATSSVVGSVIVASISLWLSHK